AYKISGGANGGMLIAKWIIGIVGFGLAIFGTATAAPFLLGLLVLVTVFTLVIDALYQASAIIDEGGPCAVIFSQFYLAFSVTLIALGTIFGLPALSSESRVVRFVLSLVGSMYGSSELFKSVSRGCK
ncbi:MAG: hypothetical protein ABL875_03945, partial [Candidatus Nitrotoga sp.]